MNNNSDDKRDMTGFIEFTRMWNMLRWQDRVAIYIEFKLRTIRVKVVSCWALTLLTVIIGLISFEALPYAIIASLIGIYYASTKS